MIYNIAFWNGSMEYGLQYCHLGRFHGVRFTILPSGTFPWTMIYHAAIWDVFIEYDLQYCLLERFNGVWLKMLSSVGLWNTAIVIF
jgi:hypothetical protein